MLLHLTEQWGIWSVSADSNSLPMGDWYHIMTNNHWWQRTLGDIMSLWPICQDKISYVLLQARQLPRHGVAHTKEWASSTLPKILPSLIKYLLVSRVVSHKTNNEVNKYLYL